MIKQWLRNIFRHTLCDKIDSRCEEVFKQEITPAVLRINPDVYAESVKSEQFCNRIYIGEKGYRIVELFSCPYSNMEIIIDSGTKDFEIQ